MIPSVGSIVLYTLNSYDATNIRAQRMNTTNTGNSVTEGDVYPMLITRIWSSNPVASTPVQGQVFLDGNDNLWVTSCVQGKAERQWQDPREAASS